MLPANFLLHNTHLPVESTTHTHGARCVFYSRAFTVPSFWLHIALREEMRDRESNHTSSTHSELWWLVHSDCRAFAATGGVVGNVLGWFLLSWLRGENRKKGIHIFQGRGRNQNFIRSLDGPTVGPGATAFSSSLALTSACLTSLLAPPMQSTCT